MREKENDNKIKGKKRRMEKIKEEETQEMMTGRRKKN